MILYNINFKLLFYSNFIHDKKRRTAFAVLPYTMWLLSAQKANRKGRKKLHNAAEGALIQVKGGVVVVSAGADNQSLLNTLLNEVTPLSH